MLTLLAKAKQAGQLQSGPEQIISVAEVLEETDAAAIRQAFQRDLLHQVYQCTEGFLGATCAHGTLHLNEDLVKVEKEWIDNRRFVPVITDFCRTAQPIVRYRMGDILVERAQPCPCGSPFLALEKIEGREDDVFYLPSFATGEPVPVFADFIRRCILFAPDIREYRVVQMSGALIYVYMDDPDRHREGVHREFETLFLEFGVRMPEIQYFDYAARPPGDGKLCRVKSLMKQDGARL